MCYQSDIVVGYTKSVKLTFSTTDSTCLIGQRATDKGRIVPMVQDTVWQPEPQRLTVCQGLEIPTMNGNFLAQIQPGIFAASLSSSWMLKKYHKDYQKFDWNIIKCVFFWQTILYTRYMPWWKCHEYW